MGVQVTFNYANWIALFPEFTTTVSSGQAALLLTVANGYIRNDGGGPVTDSGVQTSLQNFVMAHLAQLLYGSVGTGQTQGSQAGQLVGRIASAGEGSVNVSLDFPTTPTNAWWMQTKYGALAWQLMAPFRTMQYVRGPRKRCAW